MKKTTFIASVFLCLFVSCVSDLDVNKDVQEPSNVDQGSNVLRTKSLAKYYVNEEKALVFETREDYACVLNMIAEFSNDEFHKWEKEIGFLSYRSFTDELFENVDNTKSLVDDYPKYFTLANGSVETKVISQLQKSIINLDGFFYIGNTRNEAEETEQVVAYAFPTEQVGDAINIPIGEYHPESSDYKITSSCRILKLKGSDAFGTMWAIALEIANRPKSLHYFGGWQDTKTACWIEEVKVHMNGLGFNMIKDEFGQTRAVQDQFMDLPTYGGESLKSYTRIYMMQVSQIEPGKLNDPYCVHYRARIGKFGTKGLAVNYYHSAPGITCPHRPVAETQTEIFYP